MASFLLIYGWVWPGEALAEVRGGKRDWDIYDLACSIGTVSRKLRWLITLPLSIL